MGEQESVICDPVPSPPRRRGRRQMSPPHEASTQSPSCAERMRPRICSVVPSSSPSPSPSSSVTRHLTRCGTAASRARLAIASDGSVSSTSSPMRTRHAASPGCGSKATSPHVHLPPHGRAGKTTSHPTAAPANGLPLPRRGRRRGGSASSSATCFLGTAALTGAPSLVRGASPRPRTASAGWSAATCSCAASATSAAPVARTRARPARGSGRGSGAA